MELTIFYKQPLVEPKSAPAVEPVKGDFSDVAEARRIAMVEVGPAGDRSHCAGFEIWNTRGETVASWTRPQP